MTHDEISFHCQGRLNPKSRGLLFASLAHDGQGFCVRYIGRFLDFRGATGVHVPGLCERSGPLEFGILDGGSKAGLRGSW